MANKAGLAARASPPRPAAATAKDVVAACEKLRSVPTSSLMPAPLFFRGQRLPASYANFYLANSRVLMPTFNDPNDRKGLGILADLFPNRAVVGIHAGDLIWGLGTLHCLTQQQPAQEPRTK